MLVDYSRILKCSDEEKDSAIEVVDLIRGLSDEARKYGLLRLENMASITHSKFLEKAVMLVVSGTDPESVEKILGNYIKTTELSDIEYLIRVLYMDGVLLIQQGVNPDVLDEHLCSYFGESYIEWFSEHFSSNDNVQQLISLYRKEEVDNTNSPELDKTLENVDMRSLQRILRECSLVTINIACAGASKELRQRIVDSIAMAQWSNYLESTEMFAEVTLPMIRGSQESIIKVVQQLRQAGEIT